MMGFYLPALLGFLSGGAIKFLALLEFNSKELPGKATKRFGIKRFSEMLEWDDARIGFYGLVAIMILAILAKSLVSFQAFPFFLLAKYALYFAIYNIIPFSTLDGMKIFMGSRPLYIFCLGLLIITGVIVFF
jgi:Zn-dependent protease